MLYVWQCCMYVHAFSNLAYIMVFLADTLYMALYIYLLLNQMWTVIYNCSPCLITLNLALTFVTDLYRMRLNFCRLQIC